MATLTRLARQATLKDAEEVTDVLLASMPDNPSWGYHFFSCSEYPEDRRKHNSNLVRRFISPDNEDWAVMVIDEDDRALGQTKVVAFPAWT